MLGWIDNGSLTGLNDSVLQDIQTKVTATVIAAAQAADRPTDTYVTKAAQPGTSSAQNDRPILDFFSKAKRTSNTHVAAK